MTAIIIYKSLWWIIPCAAYPAIVKLIERREEK